MGPAVSMEEICKLYVQELAVSHRPGIFLHYFKTVQNDSGAPGNLALELIECFEEFRGFALGIKAPEKSCVTAMPSLTQPAARERRFAETADGGDRNQSDFRICRPAVEPRLRFGSAGEFFVVGGLVDEAEDRCGSFRGIKVLGIKGENRDVAGLGARGELGEDIVGDLPRGSGR